MTITGRDGFIVAKALYQAIKYQQRLKEEGSTFYEWSDQQDMKAILNEAYGSLVGVFLMCDRHTGQPEADLNDEKRSKDDAAA